MSTMLEQLALVFVAAALLMIPAIALVFTIRPRRATRRMPPSSHGRRRKLAMAAGGIGLAAICIGLLIGRTFADSALAAVVVAAAVLVWLPLGRIWAGRGIVAWALTVAASAAFLTFSLLWTVTADLASVGLLAGMFLWLLEAVIIGVGLANVWELVDTRARRDEPAAAAAAAAATPPRERRRVALATWASPVRHGSMLIVAGVVGAVVYLAPFTTPPDIGDLGDHADGRGSSPDTTTTEPDSPPQNQLPRMRYDDNPRPTQETTAAEQSATPATDAPRTTKNRDARPTAQPSVQPSDQPTPSTDVAPGRPTDKPPPPGQIKEPPGQSKHTDQSDQDGQ